MKTVGDELVERLSEWGTELVFGYPGDGINGILGALNRADDHPRFIQARHEEMSALEAVGYAKFSGRLGVCLATSGPGAIHLLNGLYDAKLDHVPVLAVVGQQARTALGSHYQQEVDLVTLFKDVASEYLQMATVPEQFPMLIDNAARTALSQRAPTCVVVPNDLQEAEYRPPGHQFRTSPGSVGFTSAPEVPGDDAIRQAADVLNAGARVAILVGQGARDAADEVLEVAELLGAGIAKALLGKDVLPDDHPVVTGAIGLLGTEPSDRMMADCDTLLMIGTSFPYVQFLPEPGRARGVEIDADARYIGLRYPNDVNLVGDAATTLRRLVPHLVRKEDRSWQDELREEIAGWWRLVEERARQPADPVNPQLPFWELSGQLPDGALVTADAGSAANWYARDLKLRRGMRSSLSGTLATMGCGVPYAIGAKFAHPDRPVIALVGDGAMQMNGLAELLTVTRYWHEWADPRLVVLVLNNQDLNQVTWEMRAFAGDPKYEAAQVLPAFDYAGFARSIGLDGIRVEAPEEVAPAWAHALGGARPAVIDVVCDPEVPPIPPHVDWPQAKALMKAVLAGDPASTDIIRQGFRQKVRALLSR
jgi:pyruvate dehydrogenase (quinone)